jgi:ABC-type multidrug transport system permease subunit
MASTGEVQPTSPQPSVLQTLRQPRIVLILLATWAILGIVAQVLSDSFLFDMKAEASGILAGRAFSASMVIPAIIYLWAARDPKRHRQVFWLALIEQAVAFVSYFYHWGADDIGLEGVILPAAISGGLIFLVFFTLFQPRQEAPPVGAPPTYSA